MRLPPPPTVPLRLLGALALCLGGAPAGAAPPGLALTPCVLEHPLKLSVTPAECGVLEVAENPKDPAGRRIALAVARVPAISTRKRPDALFVLAGGPGQSARQFYASVARAFARIGRDRDIVLLDQRGTGGSNPLTCPEDEDRLYQATGAEVAALARSCLATVRRHADPAFYTTSLAVGDLERARAALGYASIDLYGVSYGTRVAQQYLRRYPARVRALILDGVVPATLAIGPDVALDAERAVAAILKRCTGQPGCAQRYPDVLGDYARVRAALAAHPVPVSVPDPSSGKLQHFDFDHDQLGSVLRLSGYSADYAALLPLLLDGAAAGDYGPLAAQFLVLKRSFESIALGMHNSVVCAEDVPYWDAAAIDRAALARTFMGAAQVDALTTLCGIWPHGPVDADLHAPLASPVPALLLSGGDDPVTPPAYAAQAARGLTGALSLTLPGLGHGQLTAPCMDRVLAAFLERGTATNLEVSCLAADRPMPFFTSVNGPGP
ncbi:MAG TPA: alpha/beta fold hydrolase [Steroidobacteraceae bacterium]|nr:alpha/beta fold hydrolase [Steroidobacteraceae bacterium]